jgi:hypothetical protein
MSEGKKPYRDYRRLLEDRNACHHRDSEHWHASCIDACDTGEDVR